MFEKEAEEWVKENMDCCKTDNSVNQSVPYFSEDERCITKSAFKDGAEFGYNKANEWRYNGIPHDNKPYLCKVEHPTNYDESEYEILFFDDKDMIWFRWLTLWSGKKGNETARINRKVLAWKEIVPPKEIEKMKSCGNCNHYDRTYELCQYSLGDEDYNCRNRKWELAE